jgi:hypothetical protein
MKISLLAALTTALLLSTMPVMRSAHATTSIARCATADGSTVYTDKACSIFGAKPVPIPAPLLTHIAHDEARFGDGDTGNMATVLPAPARRSPADGCARTPTQLAMDLRGSLALGDVNRVAESYDWVGMSSRQGSRTMDRLQQLIGKPVMDSHYFDAQIATGGTGDAGTLLASTTTTVGGDAGMLQLVLGDGASLAAIDFNVHRVMGCYFIRF